MDLRTTKATSAEARAQRAQREQLYPENPVLVHLWRGSEVESQHRGAWVVCEADGTVVDGFGEWKEPVFARSSVKCLQALPLLETGAAQRFGYSDAQVALALASHNGEAEHLAGVRAVLGRIGLGPECLQCGVQAPADPTEQERLRAAGEKPSALHNNCSGKHAGFLALARHLDADPARYLEPESPGQRLVRRAVLDMTGLSDGQVYTAIDGCSAPTFRMPLWALATAFARVSNPERLPALRRAACQRMLDAVAAHPELIAGRHERICTDIARASRGRLFPKVGSEAVYAVGVRGAGRALAVKIDDGSYRGLHLVVIELLRRFGFATPGELSALRRWEEKRITNWAGLEVGHADVAF